MPSLVGGMSHRNAGSSGRNGRGRNKRTDKSSSSSTKGNGRAARSFAAVAGLVLCSVGLLGLSGNSDAGKLSSYFWGYARTQKRGAGLVARILLAAEKYEFKDESSGENATSVLSSSETEHSSVGERQMLKIVSAYECVFVWMFKLQDISYRCYVLDLLSCIYYICVSISRHASYTFINVQIQYAYLRTSPLAEEEAMDQVQKVQIRQQLWYLRHQI